MSGHGKPQGHEVFGQGMLQGHSSRSENDKITMSAALRYIMKRKEQDEMTRDTARRNEISQLG